MKQLNWCYEVLELQGDCSWNSIQETYEDLLVVWNPERFREHPRIQAQVLLKQGQIQSAFQTLRQYFQAGLAGSGLQSGGVTTATQPGHTASKSRGKFAVVVDESQAFTSERLYVHTSIDLRWRDFRGQALVGVNWSGATLIGAKLEDANLAGANLTQANLWQARLSRVNLQEARLAEANLYEAHLQRAHLKGSILEGAVLKRANLEGADLSNAELLDANFVEANLRGVFFGQVDLQVRNFKGADLSGAILNGQQLPEGSIY